MGRNSGWGEGMTKFDKVFFIEHQKTLLDYLNSPIGGLVRHSLWIEDRKHKVLKVTPNTYFVELPDGKVKIHMRACNQHAEAIHRNYHYLWDVIHIWDMKLANRLMPAWNLGFDTYTWQPDATAGLDAVISSSTPTTNYPTQAIYVGNSTGNTDRALIKFPQLSDGTIPASATASSCTLTMTLFDDLSSNARAFEVFRQKRDWVETQATWNIWKTSNSWSTAGGFGSADCEQTNIGSRSMTATEAAGDKAWTLTASAITEMINGTFTNNGFMIKADTESSDEYGFRPSDYATAGDRPELVTIAAASGGSGFFPFF